MCVCVLSVFHWICKQEASTGLDHNPHIWSVLKANTKTKTGFRVTFFFVVVVFLKLDLVF